MWNIRSNMTIAANTMEAPWEPQHMWDDHTWDWFPGPKIVPPVGTRCMRWNKSSWMALELSELPSAFEAPKNISSPSGTGRGGAEGAFLLNGWNNKLQWVLRAGARPADRHRPTRRKGFNALTKNNYWGTKECLYFYSFLFLLPGSFK